MKSYKKSRSIFQEALNLLPGGVNSPVRAFKSVEGDPIVINRGSGAYLYDVDENKYIDYVLSWGPLVLGHSHPDVVNSLHEVITKGTSYGAPTEIENKLAKLIIDKIESIEMIRFVNSGTEACMSALRLARAYTKKTKIIKFAGNYHGHADMFLIEAGSRVATLNLPNSPGVPQNTISDSILDWIDADKNHRLNGAEDDYYRKQNPPYFTKNGKIETFDELLKIHGMTKEILYGSKDKVDEDKKYKGIINHLTIYKIPTVNPNTASKEVLDVLFEPEQVNTILKNIYSKGFHSNTLSNFFRIKSTGKITGSSTEHSVEVVVEKSVTDGKPKMVIHYWNDNALGS